MGETKWIALSSPWHGSFSAVQVAPPSVVRSSVSPPAAQPCWASVKSTWSRAALPLYCLVQVRPASVVARIRPAPATQPWLGSVNWTASRAGAPREDGLGGEEADAAGVVAAPLAHDEEAADGAAAADAPVGPAEPTADGVDTAGADVPDPPPAAAAAAVDELDDVVAQPAARPAAASATMVENAARRVINGISFVTFQMTLSRLARLWSALIV